MRPLALLALFPMLAGCVMPATTPTAPPAPPTVTPAAEPTIALAHDALGADHVLPGAWIEHEGESHLWVVAFGGSLDRPTLIHLHGDGTGPWVADDEPVQMDDALGLNEIGPIPSSVLVEADGTWTMYGGGRLPGDRPVIWRATAPGPIGPWSIHAEPVLVPATDGWDSAIVDHPSVVPTADGYLMTYGGASIGAPNRNRIGAARSRDGVTWDRMGTTLEGADDGAALGPSGCGIEARTMFEPELSSTDRGYRLHYAAMLAEQDDVMVIGVAESTDAVSWTCATDGPLVEPDDVVAGASLHSYLVPRDGTERLLVEVLGSHSPSSDLWLVAP